MGQIQLKSKIIKTLLINRLFVLCYIVVCHFIESRCLYNINSWSQLNSQNLSHRLGKLYISEVKGMKLYNIGQVFKISNSEISISVFWVIFVKKSICQKKPLASISIYLE